MFLNLCIKIGCSYCGKDVLQEKGYCLDRVDSKKGYYPDNVCVCCKRCNMAKGSMTYSEFYQFIEDVYNFRENVKNKLDLQKLKKMRKCMESSTFVRNSRNVNDL